MTDTHLNPDHAFLLREVEQFFYREADLLDERRFDEWLTLLHEDIRYWMPIARNVRRDNRERERTREGVEAAWFDEGLTTLRQRVEQINTGMHWAEEPASRTSHLLTNVRILETSGAGLDEEIRTRSRFIVYQNRLDTEVAWFVGKRNDTLRRTETGWKVLRREILLDQTVLLGKALTVFF
ncbi:3-phenylpropionate/cinnamic acid dioxygenase subunit beta [Pigmentiphaga kullae]|uniref:3-phenylpropionate/cinnamic acid dioxygenase small subunit n=1 Tax=Pigmentiphaga kullae TaxID=151784 RepID=A0A4Q7NBV5_9BURK|nr:3-phenylpropionate/cinnamic acid dioxygenase subunit beta [Pigmentiphaga kullae]RZS80395.1 3-phenylpropionate/cinnamic acid dioxygenase small subunit [Pigmentiphaga kullae]